MNNHQYFAQLNDDNVVIDVAVVTHEFMQENPDRYPSRWVETFVDLPNKTYASIGMIYNETDNNFYAPPYIPIEF